MLIVIIGLSVVLLLIFKSTRKPKKFPPGPPRLPIVGSLPYMAIRNRPSNPPSLLTGTLKAIKTYGKVVGFYIGSEPYVIIADFDLIKEVLKNEATASRPKLAPFQELRPGGDVEGVLDKENSDWVPGIIFSRGRAWSDQRRFTLRVLRDFGFGKSSMEDAIVDEVDKLCDVLADSIGQRIDISRKMNISVLNSLWALLTGEKLPLNDPKLLGVVGKINDFLKKSSDPSAAVASLLPYPPMIKWPIFKPISKALGIDIDPLASALKNVADMATTQIEQHEADVNEDDRKDFIDAYLVEMKKQENNDESSFNKRRGYYYLTNVLMDLFFAGMETTSSTLTWTFLLLLHHPEIKRKLQEEIDTVIGRDRSPRISDKDNLPYTSAFMLESMRIVSFVYNSVPHFTTEKVQIGDYILPKGCGIFASLLNVMYDPNHFPDPHKLNPDRFINGDGKFQNDDHVIPFGLGKRYCLGQTLAEKEYFLFLVGIIQKFDISPGAMKELPSYHLDENPPKNLVRICPEYDIIFSSRT